MLELNGTYSVALDSKNRVAIPTQLRNQLPEHQRDKIVLIRGFFAPCITLYPLDKWNDMQQKIKHLDLPMEEKQEIKLRIYSFTRHIAFDQQGRILLPQDLLEYAHLNGVREVHVTGCGDFMQIWNPELLQKKLDQSQENFRRTLSQLKLD